MKSIQVRGESPRTETVRDTSLAVNNVKPGLLQNLSFKNVRCCWGEGGVDLPSTRREGNLIG